MQRRQLASRALAGAVLAAALPVAAKAGSDLENIVFSAGHTGHWAGLEALHVPLVSVAGSTLNVRTPHPMSQAHYIVSHTVVLDGGKFLDRRTFSFTDQPESLHTLPDGYTGGVTVTSTCNLHDFWVKRITV